MITFVVTRQYSYASINTDTEPDHVHYYTRAIHFHCFGVLVNWNILRLSRLKNYYVCINLVALYQLHTSDQMSISLSKSTFLAIIAMKDLVCLERASRYSVGTEEEMSYIWPIC